MTQQTMLSVSTRGQGLYELTHQLEDFVQVSAVDPGLLTVLFCEANIHWYFGVFVQWQLLRH